MLTDSELVVDHALTVDADARKAGRVVLTAPQKDAAVALAAVNADWTLPDFSFSSGLLALDFSSLYAGRISPVSKPFFSGSVSGSFADPALTDSPYTVDLAYLSPGRMFTGLRKSPRISDLATLHTAYASEASGAEGVKGHFATGSGWAVLLPFHLPFHRTENLSTESSWNSEFDQQLPPVGDDFPQLLSVDSHTATAVSGLDQAGRRCGVRPAAGRCHLSAGSECYAKRAAHALDFGERRVDVPLGPRRRHCFPAAAIVGGQLRASTGLGQQRAGRPVVRRPGDGHPPAGRRDSSSVPARRVVLRRRQDVAEG
jgi:hypothetical protein